MAGFSTIRRNLVMHSAHRTIGISGGLVTLRSHAPVEHGWNDDRTVGPLRLALVARASDADAQAALAALKRTVENRWNVECIRVDFDAMQDGGQNCRRDVDCFVVFARGLHVVGPGSDFVSEIFVEADFRGPIEGPLEIEIAASARRHPILDGIEPFISPRGFALMGDLPTDATCLLTCRVTGNVYPAAWTRRHCGREFHTLLDFAEGFCAREQSNFVRLAWNAIDWVASLAESMPG